jgi:non-ribosomal peptide synthetase component F
MTMLAAWGALLHAYSGQDDVLVASPVAGRQEPELQRMVGLFADMALTRLDLGGDPTFQELVGRARRAGLASYGSGLVPLDELLRAVAPGRDLSRAVAGAILNVQPASPPVAAGGVTWTPLPLLETDVVKADLNLSVIDGGDGVRASLDYAVDLFEPATAERMARHLEALVAAAAGRPEARLSDLRALDLDAAR